MKKKTSISVIVPVYNGEKFLAKCLDALRASSYQSFELIVVDDGSTDTSAEIATEKGARVIQTHRRQSGPAVARNLGVEEARGDIVLFVDADVVVRPNTLAQVADDFINHPEIAALFGSYDDEPAEKNFLSQYRNLLHHFVHQQANSQAATFWAGCGAIRREAFLAVGGFDGVQYPQPSIEDIEIGYRLRGMGFSILLDKEICVKHLKRWEVGSMLRADIFCRAFPWSKLILKSGKMVNDLNLKHTERICAGLILLSILLVPLIFIKPAILLLILAFQASVIALNYKLYLFFLRRKGLLFAASAFPWHGLYYVYSSGTFALCWTMHLLSGKQSNVRIAPLND
jgi:glycosyltransferase involved in cell wall biosynthesis